MIRFEVHCNNKEIVDATKKYYDEEKGVVVLEINSDSEAIALDGVHIKISNDMIQKSFYITNKLFTGSMKLVKKYLWIPDHDKQ